MNLLYYDATCPLVSKIHREVENFERKNLPVILIGHRNHPGYRNNGSNVKRYLSCRKKEDVKELPFEKINKLLT